MLFSIHKVKKTSTVARWLGNCIILLLSSLLPINLVAKAGHQTQDAARRERPEHLRSAAGLAVGDLSQPERLLQEESPPGVVGEEMALHPSP